MNEFLKLLLPWLGPINWITDGFVYIIGAAFLLLGVYFFVRTFFQRRLINGLTKEVGKYNRPAQPQIKQELHEEFVRKGELTEAWQEFEDSLITGKRPENREAENQEVVYKTDEASLFFSEERLLDQHLNLRFWNSVPALLVGLGILGTFVGLVWGLIPFSDIDFTNTDQIREAIKELLSGVSTAFVSSVWGMLASLLFNGLEKWRIGRVSRAIADLQRALDQIFTLTRAEEIAMRQQDELAQQTAALKSVSTDFAIAIGHELVPSFDSLNTAVADIKGTMVQGQTKIIGELHKAPETFSNAIAEKLVPSLNNLNTAVRDSTNEIKNAMKQERKEIIDELHKVPEAFSNAIAEKLVPSFENLNTTADELRGQSKKLESLHQSLRQWQDQNMQERKEILAELRNTPEAFSNAMAKQLVPSLNRLNTAIEELRQQKEESSTDAIGKLITEFQDSLSTSTVTQMEELAKTVGDASQSLKHLPDQMEQMVAGVREQIDQTRQLLAETSEAQTEQMRSMIDGMLDAFQRSIDTQQGGLSETTNRVNEEMLRIAANIRNLLESTANRADEQLVQRTADMEAVSDQSIQTLETAITKLQQAITTTLDQQQKAIRNITSETEIASTKATTQMQQLVEQSADRLDKTFQAGEQRVSTLLQQQVEQIKAVNNQITNSRDTLAKGREMLEEMNTSVISVRQLIEKAETLSGQLTKGADQLERAGKNLTLASNAFNEENATYLEANRKTTGQLQETFVQSQRLLNDFAQRFQTIDDGLQGIFAEIEKGLNTYATTSRESINQYLGDFSNQLTLASAALAGSVKALTDVVEELTDMNEQLTRRRGNR